MKKIKLLMAAFAVLFGMSAYAQSWTGSSVGEGRFIMYNVGTGQFFTQGNDWGTRASITADLQNTLIVNLISVAPDGYYFICTGVGNASYGLEVLTGGGNIYVDQSRDKQSTWEFVNVGTANAPVYNIISKANHGGGEGFYLTANGEDTIVRDGTNGNTDYAKWVIKNLNDADFVSIDNYAATTLDTSFWTVSTPEGSLARNTWSNEGNSDGSGMTTPFIQDWVGAGTPLGEGQLSCTVGNLAPGSKYNVSALVRVFNEAAGNLGGASFFANGKNIDVDENGTPCTGQFSSKGIYGSFTLKEVEIGSDGKLTFGIAIESGSELNWVAIKNVSIVPFAGKAVQSITLSQSSAELTTGEGLTLTATVAPDDADDKSLTWTSSNESVATVSGGVVSALSAGTTEIVCAANDGSGVSASCSITVSDAPVPSFCSSEIVDGTDYYIYNVATGKFLGGANSWGTQASLIEHGIPFKAIAGEGAYTLDSYTYNKDTQHFFNGSYVDGDPTNIYIVALGNGKFSISTAEGSGFLTAVAGSTVLDNTAANANSSFAQWYFLSKEDRDKALAEVTDANPVDATYYIKEANISRNLYANGYNQHAWSGLSTGGSQDNTNFVAQVWNGTVEVSQTIENIPNGTYTLTMQGFTSGTDVKLHANDDNVEVRPNDSGVASCSAASKLFAAKEYPNTLTTTITNNTLVISLSGDCTNSKWLCFDDFELYMTYNPTTGISEVVNTQNTNAIFNLSGQKVEKAAKGLYIINGKKVVK